ncbi:MAG TPA: YhbY family RNA-binding protein [Nitrosospira sp.]|nr:YhbY family RNA-binding protein [Nitrosospira sp.]
MLALTPAHRRMLAATAHGMRPVVMIGEAGLSENVMHELDLGLKSHQLIKVRVSIGERKIRNGLLEEICRRLAAAPVQHIGKILVIYRPEPKGAAPESKGAAQLKKKKSGRRNIRKSCAKVS